MHARLRLDVGWRELLSGGAALFLARDRAGIAQACFAQFALGAQRRAEALEERHAGPEEVRVAHR